MYNSSWRRSLRIILATPKAAPSKLRRCTLVGVGNELRGDDAAGLSVVRRLRVSLAERASEMGWPVQVTSSSFQQRDVQVVDAGPAPENFTSVFREHMPEVILFIDAAAMGLPAGSIQVIDAGQAEGMGVSTHMLPLATLAQYLQSTMHCSVYLLGIEPNQTGFERGLSVPVERASRTVSDWLGSFLMVKFGETTPPEARNTRI